MSPFGRTELILLVLNTLGLLGYLFWLVFRAGAFMYTQEGVLYLLPCLPFFFVYFSILHRYRASQDAEDEEDT
jgi:hypothetical protein